MENFNLQEFIHGETAHILFSLSLFIISLIAVYTVYKFVLNRLRKRAEKTVSRIDDFIIDLLRIPVLWLLFWIVFKIFSSYSFIARTEFFGTITQINNLLLIGTIGWILIKVIRILFYYFENRIDVRAPNKYSARKDLTKMKIFENIIVTLIIIVTVAAALMTFDKVRAIGISLLTSAGVLGIIAGLAAQKSIATVFAGIQIALTQPIRLDDQVIVEGQSGTIEEITLTYVVVKLWDEKRLILPVNYFIDTPFQNWTRNSSNILGTVFLYVDYSLNVDALREKLAELLENHPKWDKRVSNVQVTDTKQDYIELRILLSSADSGANFDLQVDIREKLIAFINEEFPGCFVKTRIKGAVELKEKQSAGIAENIST